MLTDYAYLPGVPLRLLIVNRVLGNGESASCIPTTSPVPVCTASNAKSVLVLHRLGDPGQESLTQSGL
jgi:hypothetical protein